MSTTTTINETYTLAHTAQCKLKLAANRPDRNLRFLIGHAFTYDKLMLKIVEIEERGMRDQVQELPRNGQQQKERRVSFGAAKEPEKVTKAAGRRSPPPPPTKMDEVDSEKTDSDDEVFDAYDEDEGEDAGGLGLSKTTSRIAQPPSQQQPEPEPQPEPESAPSQHPTHVNQFDEETSSSSSEEEYEELRSPLTPPSDADLAVMMKDDADGDEALVDLYESVRGCSCHGVPSDKAPRIERAWEVPADKQKEGMPRVAVVQVVA